MSLIGFFIGTRFEERRWASKSSSYTSGSNALNHPHRRFLVSRILKFHQIKSLLEVDCGVGPNLFLLSKKVS